MSTLSESGNKGGPEQKVDLIVPTEVDELFKKRQVEAETEKTVYKKIFKDNVEELLQFQIYTDEMCMLDPALLLHYKARSTKKALF